MERPEERANIDTLTVVILVTSVEIVLEVENGGVDQVEQEQQVVSQQQSGQPDQNGQGRQQYS